MTCRSARTSQCALLHYRCDHSVQSHVLLKLHFPWHDESMSIQSMYMLTLQQEQGTAARLAFSNPLGVRNCAPSVILVLAICKQANLLSGAKRFCKMQAPCQRASRQTIWCWVTSHAARACINNGRARMALVQGGVIEQFQRRGQACNEHSCCLCHRQCRWQARGSWIEAQHTCALMRHRPVLCSPV